MYFCTSILNSGRAACLASWQKLRCKNTLELVGNLNFKLWQFFWAGKWLHIKKCSFWLKSEFTFSIFWRFFIFWGHFRCVIKNGRLAQPPISLLTLIKTIKILRWPGWILWFCVICKACRAQTRSKKDGHFHLAPNFKISPWPRSNIDYTSKCANFNLVTSA